MLRVMVLMMTYTKDSSPPAPSCQPLEPQVGHISTSCGADFHAGDSCTDGAVGQVRHLYLAFCRDGFFRGACRS